MRRRAIGIVRVSTTKGREDTVKSPELQTERIVAEAERLDLELIEPLLDEIDVSGALPIEERRGLGPAIAEIEDGRAEVLIVSYFDRLVRSIGIQQEIIDRVEAAGGAVLTVDFGQVSHATATQWLTASQMGLVNDYVRRVARERSAEAQAQAVSRGVVPFPSIPPGYVRGEDGVLVRDPDTAPAIAEAYELRAAGATIKDVRTYLREAGIDRTYRGVQTILCSRLYLGEIHFGDLVNLEAHEPIVDRDLWRAVQRVRVERGSRPASDRLLARLGVLRCASCNGRMVVGTAGRDGTYPMYRCSPTSDCPRRVTVSAVKVEDAVVEAVKERLAGVEGRASAEHRAREADLAVERTQAELDAAIRAFSGLEDEAAARERLEALRAARDAALDERAHLGPHLYSALTLSAVTDWDRLSLSARRQLIRLTIARVLIAPGRGPDRITIELVE